MSVAAVKQLCTPNAIVTQPNRAGGGGRRTYLGEVLVGDFSDAESCSGGRATFPNAKIFHANPAGPSPLWVNRAGSATSAAGRVYVLPNVPPGAPGTRRGHS